MTILDGGAMKDEMKAVQLGYVQVAANNETDPDGRGILLIDFQKEAELEEADCDGNINGDINGTAMFLSESLLRALWYQLHIVLKKESVQRRGVVTYVRCVEKLSDWRASLTLKILSQMKGCFPVRFSGLHVMNPPFFINTIIRVIKPAMGKKLRNRINIHSGSSVNDLLQSLSLFGLGTKDKLPVHFGGKLELM